VEGTVGVEDTGIEERSNMCSILYDPNPKCHPFLPTTCNDANMKTRLYASVLTTAAVLSLAACGSSKSSDASSSSDNAKTATSVSLDGVKPCELVTQAEAEAAFGGKLKAGNATNDLTPACIFGGDGGAFSDNVQIQAQQPYVFDGTKASADTKTVQDTFTIESVSGIGDDAFYQSTKAQSDVLGLTMLAFKKKNVAIYVSISKKGASLEQIKSGEKQLAEKAASRL
jgi:hypothetical protein